MKNAKWGILILVATIVLVGMIWGIASIVRPQGDENVQAYKKALNESVLGELFHYAQEKNFTDISGETIKDDYAIEVYKLGGEYLRIDTFESGKGYSLAYDGFDYEASLYGNEESYVHKNDNISALRLLPQGVDSTYFSIDDRYVTYEETDTQFIVTYENNYLIGKRINGAYYEEDKDGYTSAVSVAYFDKEWNLQELEVTEKWISITKDGQEYEREQKITVHYYETSVDEIEKIFEETKTMLDALME